jgi:hypothetical protein
MGLVMIMLRSAWQDVLTPMGHASDYAKELDVVYDNDEQESIMASTAAYPMPNTTYARRRNPGIRISVHLFALVTV